MIGIINCDLDLSPQTNGAQLFQHIIPESEIIDLVNGELPEFKYSGFIITGSRASFDDELNWIPTLKKFLLQINQRNIPCLAICFGMQMVTSTFGGVVTKNVVTEEGFVRIALKNNSLFENLDSDLQVYESHHDMISQPPPGSIIIAKNATCIQGFLLGNIYCVQFHPEISAVTAAIMAKRDGQELNHIPEEDFIPEKIISNFVKICKRK